MNNTITGAARTRLTDAISSKGLTIYGDHAQCPAHDDRHPSLSIGDAKNYQGIVLHCQAGCPEQEIWEALGLPPTARYDNPISAIRDQINTLRHVPVEWYPGDIGRQQRLAYDAFLRRAHEANTLTGIAYSKRDIARDSSLSDESARRRARELCLLGLIHPKGTPGNDRHAKSYDLITQYRGNLIHSGPHTKYKTLEKGSLDYFLYGPLWSSQNTIPPDSELAVWLRPSGLAVVRAMTKAAMRESDIVKASGVSKSTVYRVLRCKLRSNRLAEVRGGYWTLGDLTGFHPGTDISGGRERRRKLDREAHETRLRGRDPAARRCDSEDGNIAVVKYRPQSYGVITNDGEITEEDDMAIREEMSTCLCAGCDAEVRDKWKSERIIL